MKSVKRHIKMTVDSGNKQMLWNLRNFCRVKCGIPIQNVAMQFSFLIHFGQGMLYFSNTQPIPYFRWSTVLLKCIVIFTCHMCDYNVKSVQGNQLNKESGEKLSKDHGIIIVNCLQEMLLRKGSKNIWTEFSVDWIEKETLQKYLIQNCKHSIETNTTHNYCQETFLAWLLKSFDSYSMGHII